MNILPALAVALLAYVPAAAAHDNLSAVKARVAACKTERCVLSVTSIFSAMNRYERVIKETDDSDLKKKLAKELEYLRAQLHDPELFVMMEDGRWGAMTEAQKKEWSERWWPK